MVEVESENNRYYKSTQEELKEQDDIIANLKTEIKSLLQAINREEI